MKNWMLALSVLASTQAFANNVEDLSTDVETEQLEVYDQKAMDQQARKETVALERQSQRLEAQMKQLQIESTTLSQRIGFAQEHYAKVAKLARETEGQSHKLQAQRDKLKAQLDAIKARSNQAQSRLQSADELAKNLNKDIRDQSREKSQLEARQRGADAKLQRAARNIKKLRNQQRNMSQNNSRIQQKAAGSEERALTMDESSLESEL